MKARLLDGPGEADAFRMVERDIPKRVPGWLVIATSRSPEKAALPEGVAAKFIASDATSSPKDDARIRHLMECVTSGRYRPNIHRVFSFDEISEAHRVMGANEAVGKLVVLAS